MKRWGWLVVLSLGIAFVSRAWADDKPVNLVRNGDAETGTLAGWDNFSKVISDNPHSGKYCFLREGYSNIMGDDFIPIDPAKTYTLTVWMKSAGKDGGLGYAGYASYDADKKVIEAWHVLFTPETDTALVEACTAADKVIKIANGAKWVSTEWSCIAFKTDDSGKYADLPNRNVTPFGVLKVENKGTYWEVQLKEPCGQSFPAGTKVREHVAGGTFLYSAAAGRTIPTEWTECTGVIKSMAVSGAPWDQWWPGTKYVRILLIANYAQDPKYSMAFDDISLTASDK